MPDVIQSSGTGLNLFKATIRLAGGADACHIVAHDLEDALKQIRTSYDDLNVLYIETITRVGGPLLVTDHAKKLLEG